MIAVEDKRFRQRMRRQDAKRLLNCINGPIAGGRGRRGIEHGPVIHGGKCQRCLDAWKRTK